MDQTVRSKCVRMEVSSLSFARLTPDIALSFKNSAQKFRFLDFLMKELAIFKAIITITIAHAITCEHLSWNMFTSWETIMKCSSVPAFCGTNRSPQNQPVKGESRCELVKSSVVQSH